MRPTSNLLLAPLRLLRLALLCNPAHGPLASPANYPLASYSVPQEVVRMIKEGKHEVNVLMTFQANPVFDNPEPEVTAAVLKDEKLVPHLFAVDSFITETAALADIVLPAATYLESWGVQSVPSYQLVPSVSVRQPVVPPQGESVPVHDILIELARRTGGGMEKYFSFSNMESYISAAVAHIEGLAKEGGVAYLKTHGVWTDASAPIAYQSYRQEGFKTPSGKYEVHSKTLESAGFAALPTYEPIEATRELRGDEFVLITFQSSVHNGTNAPVSMWLSEIDHENPLWINAEVAKAAGIKRGDKVRVVSQAGEVTAKAQPSHGIHPKTVAICRRSGHWEYGKVARGERFESKDPNTRLIWWDGHGNSVHAYRLIPVSPDPIGGSQAWMDTRVTISKA